MNLPEARDKTPVIKTLRAATEVYFAPKPWEKSGTLYERLGVNFTRHILLDNPLIRSVKRRTDSATKYGLGKPTLEGANKFDLLTRPFEISHLFAFLGGASKILDAGINTHTVSWSGLIFVAINAPLLTVYRYNRARVYRIMDRARNNVQFRKEFQPRPLTEA